jgi:myo-inositol catabolism protein IolH
MRLAYDPYMLRDRPIEDAAGLAATLGYEWLELTPRDDFLPYYLHPRADADQIARFRAALDGAGVELASLMVLYNWSDPDEPGRQAAVSYWRRAVEIAVELGCTTMNSEFSGDPDRPAESESAFWRSMDELVPLFEREGLRVDLEPHPGDFVELNEPAVDMVRAIGSDHVRYLYCAPHTFHLGDDAAAMVRHAAPVLEHVHLADSYNHKASSGFRYIVNPADAPVRVHQHNVIGVGEVEWTALFAALADVGFDGVLTSCVLGWEDRAEETSREMRAAIDGLLSESGLGERLESPGGEAGR